MIAEHPGCRHRRSHEPPHLRATQLHRRPIGPNNTNNTAVFFSSQSPVADSDRLCKREKAASRVFNSFHTLCTFSERLTRYFQQDPNSFCCSEIPTPMFSTRSGLFCTKMRFFWRRQQQRSSQGNSNKEGVSRQLH
jgi:hypothetical protein